MRQNTVSLTEPLPWTSHSQYVPDGVADLLLKRWTELLGGTGGFQAAVLKDANHRAARATEQLLRLVDELLTSLT